VPRSRNRAKDLEAALPVFVALSDATRLRLVSRLSREGPLSISALTKGTDVTRQAVTKHLRVLAAAELVRDQRRGRERLWRMRARRLEEARRCLGAISAQWDEAIARLKSHLENGD
jgi:DNA-binding transcriptional ArsR family regulator